MAEALSQLIQQISDLAWKKQGPVLVALDGRSGVGKSTLARRVAHGIDATVIEGDDFYAGGTAEQWDAMSPAERADRCIDWRRQRPVLAALGTGQTATWQPYDWANDGGLASPVSAQPTSVIILEGAYSARPELAGLIDVRVFLLVPDDVREVRLRRREGEDYRVEWEARWASAERHYFTKVMPPQNFDLVLQSPDCTGR
jgi:uridine kinase